MLLTLRLVLPRRGWGRIPGRNGAIGELTGLPPERVRVALDELVERGLIHLFDEAIYLTPLAARARSPRARPKPEEPRREASKQKKRLPKLHEYSPEFEEAWRLYPKREGGNPKRTAYRAWNARLEEGVRPEELIEAVKRYAAYIEAREEAEGPGSRRYVLQAATFFGPNERWKDDYETDQADGGYNPYSPYGE